MNSKTEIIPISRTNCIDDKKLRLKSVSLIIGISRTKLVKELSMVKARKNSGIRRPVAIKKTRAISVKPHNTQERPTKRNINRALPSIFFIARNKITAEMKQITGARMYETILTAKKTEQT
jgi:hypothetical protein